VSVREIAAIVLGLVGLLFSLSGAVGIMRMPDLYTRIQCSGKTATMGALPAILALVVGAGWATTYTNRALIVLFLITVLNPASAHALSRAAYKVGVPLTPRSVAAARGPLPEDAERQAEGGEDA
jgi:multicomponent Na+:H+ antiporter subunit G